MLHSIRKGLRESDASAVEIILSSTGFFRRDEIAIAIELVHERLANGVSSGYNFIFADLKGVPIGFLCWGRIPLTTKSFDEYWIAVRNNHRGRGVGSDLQRVLEEEISLLGGGRLYVETSDQVKYEPTRKFYESNNFIQVSHLIDFYSPGDGKLTFLKMIG